MDQQYHAPDPRSGAIRQAELNPILGYKPDFMPSVVESTFPQVQDELKVADYHDLLEIPLETNKPDTEEMISRVEGNIRSTFVQNLQILKMAEITLLDPQAREQYDLLRRHYGTHQYKWIEMTISKNRQQREGQHKLNEYNQKVNQGIEYDTRRSRKEQDRVKVLIAEKEAYANENEGLRNRWVDLQRAYNANKNGIGKAVQLAFDKLEKAVKEWLEAVQFEKVARAEFLEALKAGSEEGILHAKAIHKSALKSTQSTQEHKDSILELFFSIGELGDDLTKDKLRIFYQTMIDKYNFPSALSREREELEESNHQEYYQRMKATIEKEETDRAGELANWHRNNSSSSWRSTPPFPFYHDLDSAMFEPGSVRAEMTEEERKEMELVEKTEAEKEKKEAEKAKKEAEKDRSTKARAEKRGKKAAEAERLRVEAAEKERKEQERIEKREATKARKAAEKELAAKARAEKKAAKAEKKDREEQAAKAEKKDREEKAAAKKDREERAKHQTRAASARTVRGRVTRETLTPPVEARKTRAASAQPVGVRKTRSNSKRPSPSLADQEGVAERVLEAVEEESDDIEIVEVVKREPSLSPV